MNWYITLKIASPEFSSIEKIRHVVMKIYNKAQDITKNFSVRNKNSIDFQVHELQKTADRVLKSLDFIREKYSDVFNRSGLNVEVKKIESILILLKKLQARNDEELEEAAAETDLSYVEKWIAKEYDFDWDFLDDVFFYYLSKNEKIARMSIEQEGNGRFTLIIDNSNFFENVNWQLSNEEKNYFYHNWKRFLFLLKMISTGRFPLEVLQSINARLDLMGCRLRLR